MNGPSRAWFVSDVHLNPADTARTERFLHFLDAWKAADASLYILGDLFDYWLGDDHAAGLDYRAVLDRFASLATHHHPIFFLFGNRDFLIDRADRAPKGLRFLGFEHDLDLGGKRIMICHGDRLCTRDKRYQRMRRVLQSGPVRVTLRGLPLPIKERMALRMRRASQAEIARKDAWILEIPPEALAPHFSRGIDTVICGHIHQQAAQTVQGNGKSGLLYTLKDWCDGSPYLEWNGDFEFKSL